LGSYDGVAASASFSFSFTATGTKVAGVFRAILNLIVVLEVGKAELENDK
jgi:hypothetical protein